MGLINRYSLEARSYSIVSEMKRYALRGIALEVVSKTIIELKKRLGMRPIFGRHTEKESSSLTEALARILVYVGRTGSIDAVHQTDYA